MKATIWSIKKFDPTSKVSEMTEVIKFKTVKPTGVAEATNAAQLLIDWAKKKVQGAVLLQPINPTKNEA